MPKKSHRKCDKRRKGPERKPGNKNPTLTKQRVLARLERDNAILAAIEARERGREPAPEDDDVPHDEAENRVVVKFFWRQLGSPTDPDEWKRRDGVISVIRRRMGAGAPVARTVERTLQRIVEDISRYPEVIAKIIEYRGGVVPDYCIQLAGCSKRKRNAPDPSRIYTPSPEVAAVLGKRAKVLREKARSMVRGSPEVA